jgi:curli biogenesis system outer membrane secretion channel CsgG
MNRAALLLSCSLVAAPALAAAQEIVTPRPSVTVATFDTDRTGWMPPPHLGETLAELLADRLIGTGAFRVVDRQWLVSASSSDGVGRVPFAHVVDRASQAGVDYVIAGAVTRLSIEKSSSTTGGGVPLPLVGGLFHKSKTESVLGLVIRVIDLRTGEVVATSAPESAASQTQSGGGGFAVVAHVPIVAGHGTSRQGFQDRLLDLTMQEAVTMAAETLRAAAARLAPAATAGGR